MFHKSLTAFLWIGRIEAEMDSNYEFLGLNLERLMEMWNIWDKYIASEQVKVVQFFTTSGEAPLFFLENYREKGGGYGVPNFFVKFW